MAVTSRQYSPCTISGVTFAPNLISKSVSSVELIFLPYSVIPVQINTSRPSMPQVAQTGYTGMRTHGGFGGISRRGGVSSSIAHYTPGRTFEPRKREKSEIHETKE